MTKLCIPHPGSGQIEQLRTLVVQVSELRVQRREFAGGSREEQDGEFYEIHFPEGIHKLSKSDLELVAGTLERASSDDILNPVSSLR